MAKATVISFDDAADILSDSRTKTILCNGDGGLILAAEAVDRHGKNFVLTICENDTYLAVYP